MRRREKKEALLYARAQADKDAQEQTVTAEGQE